MNEIEAATLLTQTAIENNMIDFDNTPWKTNYEKAEAQNQHNAKQISDFYTYVFEAIRKADR